MPKVITRTEKYSNKITGIKKEKKSGISCPQKMPCKGKKMMWSSELHPQWFKGDNGVNILKKSKKETESDFHISKLQSNISERIRVILFI